MFGAFLEVDMCKICTTPARESDLEVKIVKTPWVRSTSGSWASEKLHPACAAAIWKSKSLKHQGLGTFLEVESPFCVAGAGNSTACIIRGRRRSSWGLQKRWQAWWIWRGSETMRFAWQAQGFCGLWCRCLKHSTQNPWKGCKFHVTEVLLCSDHFAWQLQDFVCLGSTFSWQAQYFWSIHLKIIKTYWNSEVKCLLNMSILKEVSRKCFVFDLQSFNFEGSLAEQLRFSSWKLQFWRKSRRKASFLSFKATFLKEVSQISFVFELQSYLFEGSLAQKLRFWSSKLRFWRKSRRNASFLSFKASILKEVSQKSFVWQNNLNHTSVDNQLTWTSNHLTAKSLESQINWQPTHLNLRSIDNQLTGIRNQLTNKINRIAHRLTTKSFESQINWEPTLESRTDWQPNHVNLKLIDNQINWIWNQLTTTSLEVRINRQPKSFEAHIDWQPNHLNLKSIDNQIIWLSIHLNLTSTDFRSNWAQHTLFL